MKYQGFEAPYSYQSVRLYFLFPQEQLPHLRQRMFFRFHLFQMLLILLYPSFNLSIESLFPAKIFHTLYYIIEVLFVTDFYIYTWFFCNFSYTLDGLYDTDFVSDTFVSDCCHIICYLQRRVGIFSLPYGDIQFVSKRPLCLIVIGVFA